MDAKELRQRTEKLYDLKEELEEVLENIRQALRGTPEESAAKSYWFAHIRTALDKDHGYLGGSFLTMQETIDAMDEAATDAESLEESEGECEECGRILSSEELKARREDANEAAQPTPIPKRINKESK